MLDLPAWRSESGWITVTHDEVIDLLPHRGGKLLIHDDVRVHREASLGETRRRIIDHDCEGHFPGYLVLPGVMLVELIAQIVAVVALKSFAMSGLPVLASISEAKFRQGVRPGDTIIVRVRAENRRRLVCGEGAVLLNDKIVATVTLTGVPIPIPTPAVSSE